VAADRRLVLPLTPNPREDAMTLTATVHPLAESRPTAHRWPARAEVVPRPAQPTLDLRPAEEPVVLASPADLADRTAPGLPDARAWGVALATTLLEVVAGRRPSSQLGRWLAADVLTDLPRVLPDRAAQAALRAAAPDGSARLQSVRLQYPRTGAAEVGVHARFGRRSLAMALRLEAHQARWLCTALQLAPAEATAPDRTT